MRASHSRLDVSGLRDPQLAGPWPPWTCLVMISCSIRRGWPWDSRSRKWCIGHYDFKEEVQEIVAERKAAGNSLEACRVARRKLAHLKDQWWNK